MRTRYFVASIILQFQPYREFRQGNLSTSEHEMVPKETPRELTIIKQRGFLFSLFDASKTLQEVSASLLVIAECHFYLQNSQSSHMHIHAHTHKSILFHSGDGFASSQNHPLRFKQG